MTVSAHGSHEHHLPFEIPKLRAMARHAIPHLLEGTLIPIGIFYLSLWQLGTVAAIAAALAWSYLALLRRVARRERVPGLLILGIAGLTARSVIAIASGSLFVYFLQPSLATAAIGGAFLFSIPAGRPLAQRLAHDFVPFPDGFTGRPAIRRLFMQISAIWALVQLINAAGTVLLLVSAPIATYLAAKTGLTAAVTGTGIVVSTWWFKRGLARHHRSDPLPAAVPGVAPA